ncbi:MAG: hypothetical protein SFY96_06405 [Planctomycetota bacterium]|nr:hypothetical protein [Planctomycetota bacterium]
MATSIEPLKRDALEQLAMTVREVLLNSEVINAELWIDREAMPERPGRLQLPPTETVFLRVERVKAVSPA